MRKIASLVTVLMLTTMLAFAQGRPISGKVTDPEGQPIPFASVKIKGSATGVSANENGDFTINASKGQTLVITSTSYSDQEFKVGDSNNIIIKLTGNQNLQEVVVTTALGVKREARATGYSTANIPTKELTQAKVTNVANGLSGKVSGLQINTVNNGVNADTRIVLRGERSILGNNQALIVIDNVPVSADYINSLNPGDVENVSILKGAGAAALYGSQASNGVILITTKKGNRNKPSVTYTSSVTSESISFFPKLNTRFGAGSTEPDSINSYTGYYGRIPYENQFYGPEYDGSPVALGYEKRIFRPDGSFVDTTQQISYDYKNSVDKFFVNGLTLQNGISYQGGTQNSTFFLSGQMNNTTGTVPHDRATRYSVRMGGSNTYNKFTAGYSIGYTKFVTNTAGNDYSQGRPVYWNVLNTPGEVPINNYKDLNAPFANENDYYNAYYPNPYWQINNSRIATFRDDILGSVDLNFKPLSWLGFNYRMGVTASNYQGKNTIGAVPAFTAFEIAQSAFYASGTAAGSPSGVKAREFDQLNQKFIFQSDFIVNMDHKWLNNNFGTRLVLGTSSTKTRERNLQTGTNTLEIPGLYNVSNVVGVPLVGESVANVGNIGAFGSLQLSWKNFIFLELTGRNDWVSVLAPENRSFFYPGANASFVFTDAFKGLKDISWLSYGKITGSVVQVGNVTVGAYKLSNTFGQGSGFPYGTLTSFTVGNTLANTNLKPEITTAKEVGLELGLFRNRATVGISAYTEDAKDQTVPRQISMSTGYTATNVNVGNVRNQGLEVDIKLTPLLNLGPVKWNFGANLALYKSKVTEVDPTSLFIGGYTSGAGIYTNEGLPMRTLWVTDWNRDSLGRVIVSPTTGRPSKNTVKTITLAGQTTPKAILGLNTSFEWKGLSLSVLAEYRGGYVVYNNIGAAMTFTGSNYITTATGRQRFVYPNSSVLVNGKYEANTSVVVNDAATGSGFFPASTGYAAAGSNFVTSGDFWKIREAALSYAIPLKGSITNTIKAISVGLIARNLFTFLPKDNLYSDPEYSLFGTGNTQGISNENLSPPTRIFGATASITF